VEVITTFPLPGFTPSGCLGLDPQDVTQKQCLNDLVVTQKSANRALQFGDVFIPTLILDPWRKNHSTVGDAATGTGVLGAIRQIQPVK
jgi:hypothetical protein